MILNSSLRTRPGSPEPREISLNSSPSEIIGQSMTNALVPALKQLKEATQPKKPSQEQALELKKPEITNNPPGNALLGIARAFLGGTSTNSNSPDRSLPSSTYGVKQIEYEKDIFPSLKDIAPGASNNFGMPQGKDVYPYGNCAKVADQKTWDTWGGQINNVLRGGKVDFLHAARETCKRGAERNQCGQLRKAISECNIIESVQIGLELQRAMQRCEEISGIIDQNPMQVLDQVNGVINSEVAQGFLHKFLGQ
uniref:Uncharacterized protein n=1 Tax=Syphacia muris TaxID=451379 RepID=A0A0N5APT4_9BILA